MNGTKKKEIMKSRFPFSSKASSSMLRLFVRQGLHLITAGGLQTELFAQFADPVRTIIYGHKRVHSIKFQAVALPNGLIGNLFGPIEGRRHDSFMLSESIFLHDLQRFSNCPITGRPLCVYGDPAYPILAHLQRPYSGAVSTQAQQDFNTSMSVVRSSMEWLFGDVINYFKFLDFKKNLKIGLSAV